MTPVSTLVQAREETGSDWAGRSLRSIRNSIALVSYALVRLPTTPKRRSAERQRTLFSNREKALTPKRGLVLEKTCSFQLTFLTD